MSTTPDPEIQALQARVAELTARADTQADTIASLIRAITLLAARADTQAQAIANLTRDVAAAATPTRPIRLSCGVPLVRVDAHRGVFRATYYRN